MTKPEQPSIIDKTQLGRTLRVQEVIRRVNTGWDIVRNPPGATDDELVDEVDANPRVATRVAAKELVRRALDK